MSRVGEGSLVIPWDDGRLEDSGVRLYIGAL